MVHWTHTEPKASSYHVFDLHGRTMMHGVLSMDEAMQAELSIQQLQAGVYWFVFETSTGLHRLRLVRQ